MNSNLTKVSLAINALLVVLVGILFYLFFDLKAATVGHQTNIINRLDTLNVETPDLPKAEGKVMFVDLDSLQNKYDYFIAIKKQLENKGAANQKQIEKMYMEFEQTYRKYQEQGPTMTEQQMMAAQQDLQQREKTIAQKEETLAKAYSEEVDKLQKSYLQKVEDYLKRKSDDHNYAYVLGYVKHSNILYVNDSLDITPQVIEGLNIEHKATKK